MQTSPDVNLSSALERFKNHQASSDDLDLIAKAMKLGQIRFEIIPTGDSKTILQSGGVNYGESNEIHISGPVIGSLTVSQIPADQVELILRRLKDLEQKEIPKNNWIPFILALIVLSGLLAIAYAIANAPGRATREQIHATETKDARLTFEAIQHPPSMSVTPFHTTTFEISLPTFTDMPPFTETSTPTSPPTLTPTPPCPYAGGSDDETIRALIEHEAEAVNREAIDIILAIFSADAYFADYDVPSGQPPRRTWTDPLARYQDDLFKNIDIQGAAHFGIFPAGPGISGDTAYYISGSMGSYKSGDAWKPYLNGSIVGEKATQYGSDHWTLRRGSNGCWSIVRLDFNAGHVPFP